MVRAAADARIAGEESTQFAAARVADGSARRRISAASSSAAATAVLGAEEHNRLMEQLGL